ncbi:MAG: hypothetical protein PSY14_17620 [bacterium]|nr:hypothetical protein [bacterium]
MALIQPMIAQMVLNAVLSRPTKAPGMRKAEICLLAVAGILSVIGTVFLFMALHAYALVYYVPWVAATITGAGALIVGLTCAVIAGGMEEVRQRDGKRIDAEDPTKALLAAIEHATQGLEKPIHDNPRTSVLLASLAGYVAGNKLH